MPAIPQQSLVLVTGASSFIAQHCIALLVQRRYRVRGTVRRAEQGRQLSKLFPLNFEYVVVPDIAAPGCFHPHVRDACSILHVASPFHFDFQDPQSELIEPAKTGTLNVLRAADSAPTIRRVVLTSSTAAVYVQGAAPERFIASRDWNTTSPGRYYEDPHSSEDKMDMYRASKSIAEMSAWDYVKDRTMRTWDMTSICPGYVFGPPVSHASKLSVSLSIFEPFISGKKTDKDVTTRQVGNLVDVRDVALAHVRALEKGEAGFKRLGSSCGPFTWQHVVDAIHEAYPHRAKGLVPVGIPGSWKEIKDWTILDCQETEDLLGFTHMSLQRTVQDTAQSLWARQTPQ